MKHQKILYKKDRITRQETGSRYENEESDTEIKERKKQVKEKDR